MMGAVRADARGAFTRWLASALWSALLVCDCATESRPPARSIAPAAFEYGTAAPRASWPAQDWYRGFGSHELNDFVDLAVSDNTDLTVARERVSQADARARQAGAAILPKVSVDANATYLSGHSQQGSGHELDWFAMLSASYEVDFWGKNRATANAGRLQAGASRAERDTVALTLLGGVADSRCRSGALRRGRRESHRACLAEGRPVRVADRHIGPRAARDGGARHARVASRTSAGELRGSGGESRFAA